MANPQYVLALDQGTTSSRAIVFGRDGVPRASAQQEYEQILPAPGHVEHDPQAIWETQRGTAEQALAQANLSAGDIAAIGVANQRETTILWDRRSGQPLANAIVWQSRVSEPVCRRLKQQGHEPLFRQKTGLVLDPYFSGTKVAHLLDTLDGARAAAERGDVLFGTVDTWLIWQLTGGACHVTDVSNASRTLMLNLETLDWDDELLEILDIPRAMLPEVRSSSEVYGHTSKQWFGAEIPIAGVAGDQQAATFGQGCFARGSAKNTYGTGCFMLLNTGEEIVHSQHNLLTTVGWQINGRTTYCLEGSIFIAGAVVQWLRDGLGIISESAEVEALADSVEDTDGVYFVPAMVGLGAPFWDPHARGTIFGITRGTTAAHLARAAVDSMAYQTRDLITAMEQDSGVPLKVLKVDGGAAANERLMQFQADLLGVDVQRPQVTETTALGAAYLAGLAVGFWDDTDDVANNWRLDREFSPAADRSDMDAHYARWQEAIRRSQGWAEV